jgi:hypothetical protein
MQKSHGLTLWGSMSSGAGSAKRALVPTRLNFNENRQQLDVIVRHREGTIWNIEERGRVDQTRSCWPLLMPF